VNTKIYRTIAIIIGLCLLLAGLRPFPRSARASGDAINIEAIEAYVTDQMRADRIPGLALGIVKDDQIVYLKGYGRADPSGRPVTPQTPFLIGSVSKAFTALAVMQLVEAGKVELDAPVQRYLPWFRVADTQASAQITVRHLLNQTSGISQYATMATMTWYDQDDMALERHVRFLENVELNRPVGQSYEYSNANYGVLGAIVQVVSGLPYEEYVRQSIFAPLEMQNSFVSQDEAILNGMAIGHRRWFGFPIAVIFPYNRGDLPDGFVISSAEDMAHFLIAQMNGGRYRELSVLSPAGVELMHTEPVPGTYGMGWFSDQINGRELIGHEGGTFNYQSAVFFDPEERVGVFVVDNVISLTEAFLPYGTTTRRMAGSIVSMAIGQSLPEQGLGIGRLSLIYTLVVLALTTVLIRSLARIPGRYRRLTQRGIYRLSSLVWRSGLAAVLHFAWPLLILYLALKVPAWKVIAIMVPDLGYWLEAGATEPILATGRSQPATHSLTNVVLPKPTDAEVRVNLQPEKRSSFSRSIRRGRRTVLARGRGMYSFVAKIVVVTDQLYNSNCHLSLPGPPEIGVHRR
jgi:CubicO group peptidase (beta-lactamase class C family)